MRADVVTVKLTKVVFDTGFQWRSSLDFVQACEKNQRSKSGGVMHVAITSELNFFRFLV
jgi:hypothetical protein